MVSSEQILAAFRGTICGELDDAITLAGNSILPAGNQSVLFQYQAGAKESENRDYTSRFYGNNCSLDFVSANTAIRHKRRWNRVAGRTERGSIDGDSVGFAKMGMKTGFEPMHVCTWVNMFEGVKIFMEKPLRTKIAGKER